MKKILNNNTLPCWLLTIAIILALMVSQLIQDGVFMDGMLYISVSKNLADGMGTFWEPHFSNTSALIFREQPPLYFGLLAVFFKIFGSSMYVERLFCFICLLLTLFYIHKIWTTIFDKEPEIAKNSWLPILFFVSIPVCFWAYPNHVEETVMTLFVCMSVYYLRVGTTVRAKNLSPLLSPRPIFNIILAGICIFLASLTKGIQGIFPIAAVFLYWLAGGNITFKKNIAYSILLVAVPFLIYGLLILADNSVWDSLKLYLENRLGVAFNGTRHNTTNNRFELLFRLFTELIPMFVIMLVVYLFARKTNANYNPKPLHRTETRWLLLVGFSGSLPLMVTLEQRGFYLVTALPFFALAGASFIATPTSNLVSAITQKFFKYAVGIAMVLLIGAAIFVISRIGKTKRDAAMLHDVYALGTVIPSGEKLGIPPEMAHKWNFRAYMVRYNYIGLESPTNNNTFFAIDKKLPKELIPKGYDRYPLETLYLDLYVLK